jgi:hypothetical protein
VLQVKGCEEAAEPGIADGAFWRSVAMMTATEVSFCIVSEGNLCLQRVETEVIAATRMTGCKSGWQSMENY